jgi:hypothetical protein
MIARQTGQPGARLTPECCPIMGGAPTPPRIFKSGACPVSVFEESGPIDWRTRRGPFELPNEVFDTPPLRVVNKEQPARGDRHLAM